MKRVRRYEPGRVVAVEIGRPFPALVAIIRHQPGRRPGGDVLVRVVSPHREAGFRAIDPRRLFNLTNAELVDPAPMVPW